MEIPQRVNKRRFAEMLSEETGKPVPELLDLIDAVTSTIVKIMAADATVSITGFGAFSSKTVPARKARNPQTGESVMVPEKRRPRFVPGERVKLAVQGALPPGELLYGKAKKGSGRQLATYN